MYIDMEPLVADGLPSLSNGLDVARSDPSRQNLTLDCPCTARSVPFPDRLMKTWRTKLLVDHDQSTVLDCLPQDIHLQPVHSVRSAPSADDTRLAEDRPLLDAFDVLGPVAHGVDLRGSGGVPEDKRPFGNVDYVPSVSTHICRHRSIQCAGRKGLANWFLPRACK